MSQLPCRSTRSRLSTLWNLPGISFAPSLPAQMEAIAVPAFAQWPRRMVVIRSRARASQTMKPAQCLPTTCSGRAGENGTTTYSYHSHPRCILRCFTDYKKLVCAGTRISQTALWPLSTLRFNRQGRSHGRWIFWTATELTRGNIVTFGESITRANTLQNSNF